MVPFRSGLRVGIVVEHTQSDSRPDYTVRPVYSTVDTVPAIPAHLMRTLVWASNYYRQPVGEMIWSALPRTLRSSRPFEPKLRIGYSISELASAVNMDKLSRAPVQRAILEILLSNPNPVPVKNLAQAGKSYGSALRAMEKKQWVIAKPLDDPKAEPQLNLITDLTPDQIVARKRIVENLGRFHCFLLHGVTGSGKTEVYLHAIAQVLKKGGQALMLVPEIGLTPQLEQRVHSALGPVVASYHSGLTDAQRHRTWWQAKSGKVSVVIGTRSAVFLPFQSLSLIVIDEEHDTSFKQQERVRYHARAVAIHRAASDNIPLVCGSATPSLESFNASQTGRMEVLDLPMRATQVSMPSVRLIDLNSAYVHNGISTKLVAEIANAIERKEQSLIFINRRGFSTVVVCSDCKWIAQCENCDINLVYHDSDKLLHCHRCFKKVVPFDQCPQCQSSRVHLLGEGTQRIEQTLRNEISGARVIRIDRDTTQSYAQFEQKIKRIHDREVDILVGTQMLSKGHHFPHVTLVGVLNADAGFYSTDFRAREHMIQQVLQVAGRAGRVEKSGTVWIQTIHPLNEIFTCIKHHDYLQFAQMELKMRRQASQPPFMHYALLRANSLERGEEIAFLDSARKTALKYIDKHQDAKVEVFDVLQSPISKILKRYRAQLLVASVESPALRKFLAAWITLLPALNKKGKLRWHIDVDPVDFS